MALGVLVALVGAVWTGIRLERARVAKEAAEGFRELEKQMLRAEDRVAGMDADELDRWVHGPAGVRRGYPGDRDYDERGG